MNVIFFLMGMIAGAAGMVLYANIWMRNHTVSREEFEKELFEIEQKEEDKAHE